MRCLHHRKQTRPADHILQPTAAAAAAAPAAPAAAAPAAAAPAARKQAPPLSVVAVNAHVKPSQDRGARTIEGGGRGGGTGEGGRAMRVGAQGRVGGEGAQERREGHDDDDE